MTKIIYSIALTAAAFLVSCSKNEETMVDNDAEGYISVSITDAFSARIESKASGTYNVVQDYEKVINRCQVVIFDSASKKKLLYLDLGPSNTVNGIRAKVGKKEIWGVINGPDISGVETIDEISQVAVDLSANSKAGGFVAVGWTRCEVKNAVESWCILDCQRFISRIAVTKISNGMPDYMGSLRVERIFLSNVAGREILGSEQPTDVWYNKEGRADNDPREKDQIINGTTCKASCPELTYTDVGITVERGESLTPETPYLLYAYRNDSDVKPDGFSTSFSPQMTTLVVAVTIDGELQYFPVPLDRKIRKNCLYTVELTIKGFGSEDPNKEVQKGSHKIDFKLNEWSVGAKYQEEI